MQSEPRVGCGAAILVDGKLLLIRRKREPEAGCWGLPGGKVDMFEPVARAVEREVAEELGITIHAEKMLCLVEQPDQRAGTHWIAPVYLVTKFTGTPTLMEPEKHSDFGWFPLEELPLPLTTSTVQAAATLQKHEP
ncbi:ADP-ribose pyrophosphatase/hydrolase [Gluconobacter thailandicus F149-1 = NBRC 100600]|uniref:ADP-ribose pyrophosphatase n=1 Tax=Gluconobacter thailandicus NBRC 3257 TaxID=1381097 RepID=A0ABQ0IYG5_GLUTH|nr:NUDIX domain-containing protein [Gluconobacter thailandicus]KXV52568.1 ADP-ribose pyrophosphatase [Gluconobacter thailandicus]GAC87236.1 ADP-ribose pyrophosphatase [Gluconobacter thailandicus NBRC 3255]GAD27245.1 ADP-ribose pyrophosphatase [Gluconobacter thailandicus NBRC 3257]GAN94005.1 ADP-ribose pyrophosphatase/hydrolase [Gluconobacter thailandicus F149-1 = NBRC 100600]GBR60773.1 ADP-ribose pyrophosphatase [Gluconobacter thailandicus F149-1 = NBRC 100600]